jgi:type IV pilus assembly protein PilO
MNELVAKLLKLKTPAKIGVVLAAIAVIAGGYWQFAYADLSSAVDSAVVVQNRLKDERATYERRKVEYLAYRHELQQLQDEQRELLRVLPKKDEMASFLSNIQEQAEMAGLEVLTFTQGAEVPEELYVKIPVQMEVRGGFHTVTKFFKNVSELRRIVNIEDLNINPDRLPNQGNDDGTAPTRVRAKFIAATFRYQDKPGEGGGGT